MCGAVIAWLQTLTVALVLLFALALAVIAVLVFELRRCYAAAEQLPSDLRQRVLGVLQGRHGWFNRIQKHLEFRNGGEA